MNERSQHFNRDLCDDNLFGVNHVLGESNCITFESSCVSFAI